MNHFFLKIWGDWACFSRPEFKVERVSYDIITPSAARGIFEAICWHPAMRWHVLEIAVLNPIQWMTVRRNEVSEVASVNTARQASRSGKPLGLYIEDARQQRASTLLRDVAYRVKARFEFLPEQAGSEDSPGKFAGMFERRARKGQTFHQPYLGCREFPAHFAWLEPAEAGALQPIAETRPLGWMLHDLDYSQMPPQPRFFNAQMNHGVITVPDWQSEEVKA